MGDCQKQKLGAVVIPMKKLTNLPVEVLLGGDLETIDCAPLPPYSKEAVDFLTELSKRLLKNPASCTYPDIAGFGYWIRKANLARLGRNFETENCRVGRGLVLHIAPGNVAVNFAFSLAFGLLSGNANIVRIPGVNHPQTTLICEEMGELLKEIKHRRVAAMTRVIKYPRQDEITAELSKSCHARILWGGDATITHLRAMHTSPRCVDICFADRYSICIMNADAVLAADLHVINSLVSGFYNDVFLLDQNACSSPHLVIWQGGDEEVLTAKNKFWQAMESFLKSKPAPPAIHAVDKYSHLCRTAISLGGSITSNLEQANLIYRVNIEKLPQNIEEYRGQYGFFFETTDNDLTNLESVVDERYQTVTCFGIDPQNVIERVVAKGLMGIDRVVPVGKALDIGVMWDGYDMIGILSRVIFKQ
jgi:hypothetical protein